VVVGLAPAWQALNVDITSALGGGAGAGATRRVRRRMRHGIVIPQIALAVALLVVAGVHVRALTRIEAADLGYRTRDRVRLAIGYVDPQPDSRSTLNDSVIAAERAERSRAFYRNVFESARQVPGASGVAMTSRLPVYSAVTPSTFVSEAASLAGSDQSADAVRVTVSPGYFNTIGIRVTLGRDFDDRDVRGATSVAMVSDALARRLWPGGSPLGKRIAAHSPDRVGETLSWMEVVGVVDEVDPVLHDRGESPFVYVPLAQQWQAYAPNLIVWGGGDLSALILRMKSAVLGADALAQVYSVQTMGEIAGEILYPRRTAASVLLVAGVVGLLLSAIGLYGVLSYSIAQRLREIGIRVALGADRRAIVALVLREAAAVAASGTGIGILLSVFALRITSTLVGAVPATDVVAFIVVPVIVTLVILSACYLPARRATRVAPIEVLRGP
jgi:putative ABC transport system permease protein